MKTTNVVATCGGNSICLINVKTGEVTGKFWSKDLRFVSVNLKLQMYTYVGELEIKALCY
jgi:hypothetical protein